MKTRKQIRETRRHSGNSFSNVNLWYYSEGNPDGQVTPPSRKSIRNDRESLMNNALTIQQNADRIKGASEFIVDWQMSDISTQK